MFSHYKYTTTALHVQFMLKDPTEAWFSRSLYKAYQRSTHWYENSSWANRQIIYSISCKQWCKTGLCAGSKTILYRSISFSSAWFCWDKSVWIQDRLGADPFNIKEYGFTTRTQSSCSLMTLSSLRTAKMMLKKYSTDLQDPPKCLD